YMVQPRRMIEILGKALFEVGPDRLLYGSEAFLWPRVQTFIDIFADLEMPEDLQDGYGYPALTREIKEQILGRNMARLLDIDVDKTMASLSRVTREVSAGARSRRGRAPARGSKRWRRSSTARSAPAWRPIWAAATSPASTPTAWCRSS